MQIHRLLAYATEQVHRLARALCAAGSHFTVIGDSIAGPDVCSPTVYRQFAAPYEKLAVERVRAEGIELGIHICGNATSIIHDMLTTGARGFELDYQIDRAMVRQATRKHASVIGTLDPSNLLPRGTADEVAAKAREGLEESTMTLPWIETQAFRGKSVLITGAGRGIGEALAERFAQAGAAVVVNDVLPERANGVAERLQSAGFTAWAFVADITRTEEVRTMFEQCRQRHGTVDIFVNSAGFAVRRPLLEVDEFYWDRMQGSTFVG